MKKFVLFGWILFSSFAFSQPDTDFAYLGVHTPVGSGAEPSVGSSSRCPPPGRPCGTGESAENAGLKLYDILLKLDDQLLINPDQLKTLVQMRNPGERISLSVLRQSKPITYRSNFSKRPRS